MNKQAGQGLSACFVLFKSQQYQPMKSVSQSLKHTQQIKAATNIIFLIDKSAKFIPDYLLNVSTHKMQFFDIIMYTCTL